MRPNIFAYPSTTPPRYLIFAVALVCAGLFVGSWVHGRTAGDEWQRKLISCTTSTGGGSAGGGTLSQPGTYADCTAGVERVRAAFLFGGAALAALGAAGLLLLAPRVIERRRRLRPLGPSLAGAAEQFTELAQRAGVGDGVQAMIGRSTQRDAFSYGTPGRYRVALPPAVATRWRNRDGFDPLVAHELAHVSRHDVALAWVVRSVWYILVPLLGLPVVVGLLSGDPSLLGDYFWRVAVLAAAVVLLSSNLLRSREHDADLAACRLVGDPSLVSRLLAMARPTDPSAWSLLRAKHPSPSDRVRVVEAPAKVTRMSFLDGAVSGFLTALAVPMLVSWLRSLSATVGREPGAWFVSAVLVGPILGAIVGLGLWRAAVVARVTGEPYTAKPVACGVGLGLAVGETASLAQSGSGSLTGLQHPWWLLVTALAGVGATLVSASLGELWADIVPAVPRARPSWLVALALNAAIFSSVLWAALQFQDAVDVGGWRLARGALMSTLSTWPMLVLVVSLAASAAGPLLRRPRQQLAPRWLLESEPPPVWAQGARPSLAVVLGAGTAAGLAGGLGMAVDRLVSDAALSAQDGLVRFRAYVWVAGLCAGAVVLILSLLMPQQGPAAGLLAAPVAALTATAWLPVTNPAVGDALSWATVPGFARRAVVLSFYLSLLAAPVAAGVRALRFGRRGGGEGLVGVWRWGGGPAGARRLGGGPAGARPDAVPHAVPLAMAASAAVAGALALAALVWASVFVAVGPVPTASVMTLSSRHDAVSDDWLRYSQAVEPEIETRYAPAGRTVARIEAGLAPSQEVLLLDSEVLPELRALAWEMAAYVPSTPEVTAVHEHAMAAIGLSLRGSERLRDAYAARDVATHAEAIQLFGQANAAWANWRGAGDRLVEQLVHAE